MPAAKKSGPQLAEVVISHSAGGNVDIRDYGKEKSNYSVFQSKRYVFGEDWSEAEIGAYVEERRQELRNWVDTIASAEHEERFNQSYLAGGDYS
jgi:hypothetical protein